MQSILTLTMNPTIDKSARVDHVVPERKLRCNAPQHEPGGGGLNVSRAIRRLGGSSVALYSAGGPPGELLQHLLNEEEIEHHPISIEGWTRENLTVYEETTHQQFRFGMPGPYMTDEEWTKCLDQLSDLDFKPDYLVASGSLPPGVPETFYSHVASVARELGARTILDTSAQALRPALYENVFLIKPNLRELRELAGYEIEHEAEQEELARKIIDNGQSKVVVISRGAGGALLVWKDGCEHFRAPTVPINSKVGAGDSMVAGIVLSLARGDNLIEAVRFGVAAGAAAVKTPGTELCRREDTENLYSAMVSRET
jgi:6-phosphofructokinase 2